jgi:hypothetical protein
MMKIQNKKGKLIAVCSDEPNEIIVFDEVTGKQYSLEEYQEQKIKIKVPPVAGSV